MLRLKDVIKGEWYIRKDLINNRSRHLYAYKFRGYFAGDDNTFSVIEKSWYGRLAMQTLHGEKSYIDVDYFLQNFVALEVTFVVKEEPKTTFGELTDDDLKQIARLSYGVTSANFNLKSNVQIALDVLHQALTLDGTREQKIAFLEFIDANFETNIREIVKSAVKTSKEQLKQDWDFHVSSCD